MVEIWDSERKNGWVNEQTINYITKYVTKIDEKHKYYKSIILTSPGIGKQYMQRPDADRNKYNGTKTKQTYKNRQGFELALPKYYRNQIYSESERENLWREMLDKEERYVMGRKIDVSKNEKEYIAVREEARELNRRSGYGTNEVDAEEKMYERIHREMVQNKRLGKHKS